MTDHGFGTGRLTGTHALMANKTRIKQVVKCISKKKNKVLWCHVVHKSTMGQKPGDLLWEAEEVDSDDLKDKIRECATNHGYGIKFGPTTTFGDESFNDEQPDKHPKVR